MSVVAVTPSYPSSRNVRPRLTPRIPTKYVKKGMKMSYKKKKSIKQLVKETIETQAEKKMVQFFNNAGLNTSVLASDWSAFNSWILTSDTTSRSMYAIAQGSSQGGRVGNQIRTYKMTLKLALFANPVYGDTTNYNPCPLYVTLWIVKLLPHLEDTTVSLQTVVQNSFFQNSGAAAGFSGNLSDLIKTPNKDQVTVLKKKVYKVGCASYTAGTAAGTANIASQQYNNNDASFAIIDTLDITKCIPAVQQFNDGDNLTSSRRSYLFFTAARVDGNYIYSNFGVSVGTRPFQTSIGLDFQYTDL